MQPQYYQQQQQTPNTANYQQVPVQVHQNAIQPLIQYAPLQLLTQQQAIAMLMAVPNDVAFIHDFTYRISCCAVNGLCGDFQKDLHFKYQPQVNLFQKIIILHVVIVAYIVQSVDVFDIVDVGIF